MKPSQLAVALVALVSVKQPVMIWGPPGAGKSSVVRQVAEKLYGASTPKNPHFIDLRLTLMDTVDVHGLPVVEKEGVRWITPSIFPRSGEGILFLDEIVQALMAVQNTMSQLILDRRIGDYVLPPGWTIVAAGNRESDRAATNRMPSHIANRFTHLEFEADATDWISWAHGAGLNPMVIAFIAFRPELLHKFSPKEKANPTPRSWEFTSTILSAQGTDSCLTEIVEGTVGAPAATEFMSFVRVFREMPDYETIKKRPEGTKIPESVSARYAVATMLARMARREDMAQVMKYVARMEEEFQILTVNDMTKHQPRLAETPSYIAWASKHKDALLNATIR